MKKPFTLKSTKSKSLNGIICVPSDKSISIRALIISSLCLGNSKIFNLLESDDVKNTMKSLRKLGVKIQKKKEIYEVYGNGGVFEQPSNSLYLGNSGTGVRLLTGLLSSRNINVTLTGDKSLSLRPMQRIIEPLELMNLTIKSNRGCLPLILKKNKKKVSIPITYNLKIGSAQIKSAILLASTNIKGTTEIIEKFPSRDHTEIMLKFFGADIVKKKKTITINSPTFLEPKILKVPGDFSSAAFLIVATLITKNSNLCIKGVGLNYYRTGLVDILKKMKAKISIKNISRISGESIGDIYVSSSKLKSVSVSRTIIPRLIDELPILFVAASFADGISKFEGLEELKFKESDRLNSMTIALQNSGVIIKQKKNSLMITGKKLQPGGSIIKTFNDHRIAMSMLIFGLASEKKIIIDEEKMIKTSFPNFKEILNSIGAKIEFISK